MIWIINSANKAALFKGEQEINFLNPFWIVDPRLWVIWPLIAVWYGHFEPQLTHQKNWLINGHKSYFSYKNRPNL